jgi:hypothetical protein
MDVILILNSGKLTNVLINVLLAMIKTVLDVLGKQQKRAQLDGLRL